MLSNKRFRVLIPVLASIRRRELIGIGRTEVIFEQILSVERAGNFTTCFYV